MHPVDDRPNAVPDIYRHRFERCFRDHYAQMLAFSMRRVSGREIAEDVVADTFAVAWRRRDRISDLALPWLYAIASHVIANQYRSTRRRRDLDLRLAHETGVVAAGPILPSRSIAATPSRPPSHTSASRSARSCA
jgi:DNA-directed RNA polymerase specialized sigma24 family protein